MIKLGIVEANLMSDLLEKMAAELITGKEAEVKI